MDIGPTGIPQQQFQQMGKIDSPAPVEHDAQTGLPADGIAPNDAERFDAAMRQPPPTGQAENVGDRVMDELGALSDRIQAGRQQAVDTMTRDNVTQADLIKAQFAMLESSTLISAASKVSEKITQAVKNLQQG